MTIGQQIDTFVQGIQCAIIQSIIVNLAGDATACTSFETYYNDMASKLELSISLTHIPTNRGNRNVNKITSGERKKSSYKERNPSEERVKKITQKNDINKDFMLENKAYPPHICKSLSFLNKEKGCALYKASRGNNNNSHQNNISSQNNVGNNIPYIPN